MSTSATAVLGPRRRGRRRHRLRTPPAPARRPAGRPRRSSPTAGSPSASATFLVTGVVMAGVSFAAALYLQGVLGLSPTAVGAWMVPQSLVMLAGTLLAPRLDQRFDTVAPGRRRPGGRRCRAAAARPARHATRSGLHLVAMVIAAGGVSVPMSLVINLIMGATPARAAGSAGSLMEMCGELGIALGVATLGTLVAALYRLNLPGLLPSGIVGRQRRRRSPPKASAAAPAAADQSPELAEPGRGRRPDRVHRRVQRDRRARRARAASPPPWSRAASSPRLARPRLTWRSWSSPPSRPPQPDPIRTTTPRRPTMTQYLMTVHGPAEAQDEFGGYGTRRRWRRPSPTTGAFNEQLRADGHWVFAGGLRGRHDGEGRRRPGRDARRDRRPLPRVQGADRRLLDHRRARPRHRPPPRRRGVQGLPRQGRGPAPSTASAESAYPSTSPVGAWWRVAARPRFENGPRDGVHPVGPQREDHLMSVWDKIKDALTTDDAEAAAEAQKEAEEAQAEADKAKVEAQARADEAGARRTRRPTRPDSRPPPTRRRPRPTRLARTPRRRRRRRRRRPPRPTARPTSAPSGPSRRPTRARRSARKRARRPARSAGRAAGGTPGGTARTPRGGSRRRGLHREVRRHPLRDRRSPRRGLPRARAGQQHRQPGPDLPRAEDPDPEVVGRRHARRPRRSGAFVVCARGGI